MSAPHGWALPAFALCQPLSPLLSVRVCCLRPASSSRGRTRRSTSSRFRSSPRIRSSLDVPAKSLIVGLTQYSHDSSAAIVDANTGELLFALSKERITRRKHDGGGVSALLRYALDSISATPEAVRLVVANNHHFPILPFEERLHFLVAMGYCPTEYRTPLNLIGSASHKVELSHHLAHAYSAIHNAPFNSALVVIMDGMGDKRSDWTRLTSRSGRYFHELDLPKHDSFREYPNFECGDHRSGFSYREAESAYTAVKRDDGSVALSRVFKRWTREVSPPELYNHGFHDMESIGAVYSRIASHIFGDWNVCGKVMGLAPWGDRGSEIPSLIEGSLYEGTLSIHADVISSLPHAVSWGTSTDADEFSKNLASRIQDDTEQVLLEFVRDLRLATSQSNLILAGGVALNSTLNGRIKREAGFDNVYIPFMPGDEGVAVGCALFGYASQASLVKCAEGSPAFPAKVLPHPPTFLPYLGRSFSTVTIHRACDDYRSWIIREEPSDRESTIRNIVEALRAGQVVAWFSGRSEFGPRALGSRSLLADPTREDMVERLNKIVKRRESFRPFAPSCLSEHIGELFGASCDATGSPYMSITQALVDPERTPAVAHVDGSARLQTLVRNSNPLYYDLVSAFYAESGTPAVLNTSFNVAGEPIVESPFDAIRTMLATNGIDVLAFPECNTLVRRRVSPPSDKDDTLIYLRCAGFRSAITRNSVGETIRVEVFHEELFEFAHELSSETGAEPLTREVCTVLENMDELELMEILAAIPGTITMSDVVDAVEGNFEGEDDTDYLQDDHRQEIWTLLESLWRKRLVALFTSVEASVI